MTYCTILSRFGKKLHILSLFQVGCPEDTRKKQPLSNADMTTAVVTCTNKDISPFSRPLDKLLKNTLNPHGCLILYEANNGFSKAARKIMKSRQGYSMLKYATPGSC